jgi:hypothetical protein
MDSLIEMIVELVGDFLSALGIRSKKPKKTDDKGGQSNDPADESPSPIADTAKSSERPPQSP